MYDIQHDSTTPQPFEAGTMKIVPVTLPVVDGETVRERAPVALTPEGVRELVAADVVAADADDKPIVPEVGTLYGLASHDCHGGFVSVYLTGEFFADALVLPKDAPFNADQLAPAFRKLGIFLK